MRVGYSARLGAFAASLSAFLLSMYQLATISPAEARQPPAAIVIDANTGRTLHSEAADEERFPASLTKMMTLYIMFEELAAKRIKHSDRITFSNSAAARPPSKLGLKPGQSLSVDSAIRALITKSANDVATAVAEHLAGSEAAFAARMTQTARRLGMRRTTFRNASGLPNGEQVTTARDMATLALALRDRFPRRFRLFALRSFKYRGRTYRNHNRLLGRMQGIDGVKTGYTRASGFNIATSLRRNGKYLVGVVMGQPSGRRRNLIMRRLLAAALPKASGVRRRRVVPQLLARPRLIERPRVVSRPSLQGSATAAVVSDRAAPDRTRAPSTLNAQHARFRGLDADASSRSITATSPRPSRAVAAPALSGGDTHQIQVGAFFDEEDARRALDGARSRAGNLLAGSRALTLRVPGKPRTIYRARFAGFGRNEATTSCAKLKRISVDCFVTGAR
jgi:D-alanyl-D-alanine carboxypeptidase